MVSIDTLLDNVLSQSCLASLATKTPQARKLNKTLLSSARAGNVNVAGLIHGALPCRTLSVRESGEYDIFLIL